MVDYVQNLTNMGQVHVDVMMCVTHLSSAHCVVEKEEDRVKKT